MRTQLRSGFDSRDSLILWNRYEGFGVMYGCGGEHPQSNAQVQNWQPFGVRNIWKSITSLAAKLYEIKVGVGGFTGYIFLTPMSPNTIFKFSRNGEEYLTAEFKDVARHIAAKVILPNDDYWTDGMKNWEKVYTRQWVVPPPIAASVPPNVINSGAIAVHHENRFYSPYASYYRSSDDRWCYGIFGGLAHRNQWDRFGLFFVRFLTLLFIFPAIFYFIGWGLTYTVFTPSLPTKRFKSYFDLNK